MLLGFNRLVQPIRITASWHNTPGKLVYNQHLIILNHIILITEHQIVRTQRQDNIMLDFQVFCICKVLNPEKFLHLLNPIQCQVHYLVLLIYNKIPCFFHFHAHNCVHLRQLLAFLPAYKLLRQNIACFVQTG